MLQNAYFLAKICADTAENEQHFAEILPKIGGVPNRCPAPKEARLLLAVAALLAVPGVVDPNFATRGGGVALSSKQPTRFLHSNFAELLIISDTSLQHSAEYTDIRQLPWILRNFGSRSCLAKFRKIFDKNKTFG